MLLLQRCCGGIHLCIRLLHMVDLVMLPLLIPCDLSITVPQVMAILSLHPIIAIQYYTVVVLYMSLHTLP